MSAKKQIACILTGMAVLLAGLGVLLAVVLNQPQEQSQPTAVSQEETSENSGESSFSDPVSQAESEASGLETVSSSASEGEETASAVSSGASNQPNSDWMERVRPFAENPQDLSQEEVESRIAEQAALWESGDRSETSFEPPLNYQMKAPPPTWEELQPGATTQVGELMYEKPLIPLGHFPESDEMYYYNLLPFNHVTMYYMSLTRKEQTYHARKISVEEAIQAEYLYLWWNCDARMYAQIQLGKPVEYYVVENYEPMTVIAVCTERDTIPRSFAIRDGMIQRVIV